MTSKVLKTIQSINRRSLMKRFLLLTACLPLFVFLFAQWERIGVSSNTDITAKKVWVRANRTLIVDHKPFFPFGLYHVSWDATAQDRSKHLQEIAGAGFNLIHASAPRMQNYGEFLDQAKQLGIYVISEHNADGLIDFVKTFQQKPAVLGWKLADDVDIYKDGKGYTPDQILALHDRVKQVDPEHITYIAGAIDQRIGEFVNTADAISATAYPVGHAEQQPISWSYHMVSTVHRAADKHRLITAALQAFRWPEPGAPMPTPGEVRNLTYQAILGGAKGILYYTYYDEAWNLRDHPTLWQGLKSLVPEIKTISPFLLDGQFTAIETGQEQVKAGIWKLKNKGLAIVINQSYSDAQPIALQLPRDLQKGKPMFQTNASASPVQLGRLPTSLKPLEIQVYSLT
jgi:hypothetical protein